MFIFFFFHGTYLLAHIYLFFKIDRVFALSAAGLLITGVVLAFLALTPAVTYVLTLRGAGSITRIASISAYVWMGFLILFFPSSILLDLYHIGLSAAEYLFHYDQQRASLSPAYRFYIPTVMSISLNIYGFFSSKRLVVKRFSIGSRKLPEGMKKLTIAHISDVHLGIIVREHILDNLLKEIQKEQPDLIVSTGDLIDGGLQQIHYLLKRLKSMTARLGKFAVIGNHEFYSGTDASQEFLQQAGFTVLRGQGLTVSDVINIAGVDDNEESRSDTGGTGTREREILAQFSREKFTVLLKHKPYITQGARGLFDLQLSGHTHKGQIFPITLAVRLFLYPHSSFKRLPDGSAINVSGGVGTAGPPVRLFSPPELIFIDLVRNESVMHNNR